MIHGGGKGMRHLGYAGRVHAPLLLLSVGVKHCRVVGVQPSESKPDAASRPACLQGAPPGPCRFVAKAITARCATARPGGNAILAPRMLVGRYFPS